MKLYGIWTFESDDKGDWVREYPPTVISDKQAILAYERKQDACNRAAEHFGYDTYTAAKRDGWCEVRQLV